MKKKLSIFLVTVFGAASLALASPFPQDQSIKDDVKDAGRSTGHAAKKTGKDVKKGTKKAAHGTKKGVNKAADATKKGADKVKDKTSDQ
jgi:hypothetical protein